MAWDGSPSPHSCSVGLEPLISQLCPSKLSWLSARFVSSSHSGAKYLYYYCNYFPISIARGSGGQRGGPDKRIDGQALPRGLPGTRAGGATGSCQAARGRAGGGWGTPGTPPCDAVTWRGGSPRSALTLSRATATQNNLCRGRARSHRRQGFASKVLRGSADLTGAPGLPRGQHSSCRGISFLGRER